jgi:hypothetical protein
MRICKSTLALAPLAAMTAAGALVATTASADSVTRTYVVCNRYDECWRVHQRYTTYPADQQIVIHDSDWYDSHVRDTHWHWLNDPSDDRGWYDKDGDWHPFAE